MIDVAAGETGEHQFLAQRGDPAALPKGADEGALRVLAFGAQDGQAVRPKLDGGPPSQGSSTASGRRSPIAIGCMPATSVTRIP